MGLAFSPGISTAAYSQIGGMGPSPAAGMGSQRSAAGGAFGTSPNAPGTNSAGTALSSSGGTARAAKGPQLGTGNPVVDREDKTVERMVHSICRGC